MEKYELYTFYNSDNTEIYKYTNNNKDLNIGGEDYFAKPISRNEFEINDVVNSLKIETPIDLLPVSSFINLKMETVYWLKIQNQDLITIFIGKVTSVENDLEKSLAYVDINSMSNIMKTNIPFKSFSKRCTNAIYDENCKLNREEYKYIPDLINVSKINNYKIRIDTVKPNGYFNYGFLKINNEFLQIHSYIDGNLNLLFPFFDDDINSIEIYPGCNKNTSECSDKFNNLINYGGFPDIPSINPAEGY